MHDAIIISDLHLGAYNSQTDKISEFLKQIDDKETLTQKLIIAGDLFDSFNSRLKKEEWRILGLLRRISKKIQLVWVKGNHDTYTCASTLAHLIGAEFYPLHFIFESDNKKIIVIHGDIFDDFLTDHPILTYISDWIYWILQKVDKTYTFARTAKFSSKKYLHCSEIVEQQAIKYAEKHNCDIVICGHSHLAVEKSNYFNSGSWTEKPCTYLTVVNEKVSLNSFV